MIVPVRRWAYSALFVFSRPIAAERVAKLPRKAKSEPGMLQAFEQMMSVPVDLVVRGTQD